jgi:hypothetical protein
MDISPVQEVGVSGLGVVIHVGRALQTGTVKLTGKHRRFDELDQFVNLDEQSHSYFEVRTREDQNEIRRAKARSTHKMYRRFDACSYACASKHRENTAAGL